MDKAAKSRNIFNPTPEQKGIIGWVNSAMLGIMTSSRAYDRVAIAKTNTETSRTLMRIMRSIPRGVFVTFDGKQFDSTQHVSLIEMVDNSILEEFMDPLLMKMGFTKS